MSILNISKELESRIFAYASAGGSSAKTLKGAVRFVSDSSKGWKLELIRKHNRSLSSPKMSVSDWKALESKRTQFANAKRASKDAKFRSKFLRKLTQEEKALLALPSPFNLASALKAFGETSARNAELKKIAEQRGIAKGTWISAKEFSAESVLIMVDVDERTARKVKCPLVMKGKDARILPCRRTSYGVHEEGQTIWKNGKPKSYFRATHDNYCRSVSLIVDPRTLEYVCHESKFAIVLPEGYAWQVDRNGLKAVSPAGEDFHPSAEDLVVKGAGDHIANMIRENAEKRAREEARQRAFEEQQKARLSAERAELEGVFVGLEDSLRAGNCKAGTIAFCNRHGLDLTKHYAAMELLKIANGDSSRVRLAISASRRRHEDDMQRGYCVLELEKN